MWHFLRIDFRASSLAKRAEFPRDAEHEIACEIVSLSRGCVHGGCSFWCSCENGQRPVASDEISAFQAIGVEAVEKPDEAIESVDVQPTGRKRRVGCETIRVGGTLGLPGSGSWPSVTPGSRSLKHVVGICDAETRIEHKVAAAVEVSVDVSGIVEYLAECAFIRQWRADIGRDIIPYRIWRSCR